MVASALHLLVVVVFASVAVQTAAAARRPNIVVFVLDDQDVVFNATAPMLFAKEWFQSGGAEVETWATHVPVCCPSRATILTGRLFHNLAFTTPSDRWDSNGHGMARQCMHIDERKLSPGPTVAQFFAASNVSVGFLGKYLNLSPLQVPTGASMYFVNPGPQSKSAKDPSGEYYPSYWLKNDGIFNNTELLYETHLIAAGATEFLDALAAGNKLDDGFFLYAAPHAPHGLALPEPKYAHTYTTEVQPRPPSWNYSAPDHHWLVRQQPPVTAEEVVASDGTFRRRWDCIRSADDLFRQVVEKITAMGQLNNTYFLWTSDHGFHFNELRLGTGKWNAYLTDLRVPMFVRGPGVPAGGKLRFAATHADLAPTWLTLAGIDIPAVMDGRSVASKLVTNLDDPHLPAVTRVQVEKELAQQQQREEDVNGGAGGRPENVSYIEYHGLGPVGAPGRLLDSFNNTFRGILVLDDATGELAWSYFAWGSDYLFQQTVFEEVFDLQADPWQLHNIVNTTDPARLQSFRNIVAGLAGCHGPECR